MPSSPDYECCNFVCLVQLQLSPWMHRCLVSIHLLHLVSKSKDPTMILLLHDWLGCIGQVCFFIFLHFCLMHTLSRFWTQMSVVKEISTTMLMRLMRCPRMRMNTLQSWSSAMASIVSSFQLVYNHLLILCT